MWRKVLTYLPEAISLIRLDREQTATSFGSDTQTPLTLATCRLAGADRPIRDGAHGLDGADDRFLIDQRPAFVPQPLEVRTMTEQCA